MSIKLSPAERYHAVMAAAAQIAAVLIQEKRVAKPCEDAVTLAFDLEAEIMSELRLEE